jgi:hypothetical protein
MKALKELAQFYEVCQSAARYLDPEERSKAVAEWAAKQPPNVQKLLKDGLPFLANVGKRIAERRVPRMPGDTNASR